MSFSDSQSDLSDVEDGEEGVWNDSGESDVEEVLPVEDDDEDDDDVSEDDDDDDEEDDDELKDEAWGKRKSTYFNTDFVDQDRGRSYREEDRELAQAEEADALAIQRKHLVNVHSSAFETSIFTKKDQSDLVDADTIAVPEWKSISKSEKRKIIKRKWPELEEFMRDFKTKLHETKKLLNPSENLSDKSDIFMKLNEVKKQLYMHHLINLSFYLHLKAKGAETAHAVSKRIRTMKTLVNSFEELNRKFSLEAANTSQERKKKRVQWAKSSALQNDDDMDVQGEEENGDDKAEAGTANEDPEKRSVTYQIVKNKGLTPYRKKEQRNPRVHHRMKFRKAEIRRKGQVQKPRTEVTRYGGEVSGIHPYVTKSIKIK